MWINILSKYIINIVLSVPNRALKFVNHLKYMWTCNPLLVSQWYAWTGFKSKLKGTLDWGIIDLQGIADIICNCIT